MIEWRAFDPADRELVHSEPLLALAVLGSSFRYLAVRVELHDDVGARLVTTVGKDDVTDRVYAISPIDTPPRHIEREGIAKMLIRQDRQG